MRKSITILGSTGSIGKQTLKIVSKKKNNFQIFLLSANKNIMEIKRQISKYNPKNFLISEYKIYKKIKNQYKFKKIKIINKINELKIKKKIDITISAIPGISGLGPTLFFTKHSKKLLIANKESIIADELIHSIAKKIRLKLFR